MYRKFIAVFVCTSILLATLACQLGGSAPKPTAALPTVVEAVATAEPSATATVDTTATRQAAEAAEKSQQATQQSATQAAESTLETKNQVATQTAAAQATKKAEERIAGTATVEFKATQQADGMYEVVNQLYKDGILTSDKGNYYALEDFNESWAQLGWYQWWKTGYEPSNFVIRAHTSWESASKIADWYTSGCGFVFREADVDNHYMIFLALDGNVYLQGFVNGNYREMGRSYAGKIDHLKGEADVMLVAAGDQIYYYVNGKKVFQRTNQSFTKGALATTLVSGTNKDFGIRCSITNMELWDLGE